MSGSVGDHGSDDIGHAIEGENIRDAGADMPGLRGALAPGSLEHKALDPNQVQGDEHRDPPENAPTPPQPGDLPPTGPMPDPTDKDWVKPT